jgi:hypothetical protein
MRESRLSGSVEGVMSDHHSYSDYETLGSRAVLVAESMERPRWFGVSVPRENTSKVPFGKGLIC